MSLHLDPKTFPGLDSPVVREPDYWTRLFPDHQVSHRLHVRRHPAGGWEWAHLLRMVSGWTVVAYGTLDSGPYPTPESAAAYVAEQSRGADGDGFDRLSREAYLQKGRIAHIRREDAPHTGYCGATGGRAEFSTREPNHVEQHCIACDRAYRAAHYGRVAVTY